MGAVKHAADREQLARIERELDAARVSREVWIGTNSIADRVTWLINRNKLLERRSTSRFDTFANEFAALTVLGGTNGEHKWMSVDEVFAAAGTTEERAEMVNALHYLATRGLVAHTVDETRGSVFRKLRAGDGAAESAKGGDDDE